MLGAASLLVAVGGIRFMREQARPHEATSFVAYAARSGDSIRVCNTGLGSVRDLEVIVLESSGHDYLGGRVAPLLGPAKEIDVAIDVAMNPQAVRVEVSWRRVGRDRKRKHTYRTNVSLWQE